MGLAQVMRAASGRSWSWRHGPVITGRNPRPICRGSRHAHSKSVTQGHVLVRVGGGVTYKEGTNSGPSCINVTLR